MYPRYEMKNWFSEWKKERKCSKSRYERRKRLEGNIRFLIKNCSLSAHSYFVFRCETFVEKKIKSWIFSFCLKTFLWKNSLYRTTFFWNVRNTDVAYGRKTNQIMLREGILKVSEQRKKHKKKEKKSKNVNELTMYKKYLIISIWKYSKFLQSLIFNWIECWCENFILSFLENFVRKFVKLSLINFASIVKIFAFL